MDFKSFAIKNILMPFFISVTFICAIMAVLGVFYQPDMRFGYQLLLSPLILGLATSLTTLVNYSKYELTLQGAMIRKLLQFVLIELIVLLSIYLSGNMTSAPLILSVAFSVLLIFSTVHFVQWIVDKNTAKVFNEALKKMQKENEMAK